VKTETNREEEISPQNTGKCVTKEGKNIKEKKSAKNNKSSTNISTAFPLPILVYCFASGHCFSTNL